MANIGRTNPVIHIGGIAQDSNKASTDAINSSLSDLTPNGWQNCWGTGHVGSSLRETTPAAKITKNSLSTVDNPSNIPTSACRWVPVMCLWRASRDNNGCDKSN
ncbi:hypothetical protein Bbelb_276370 [Branchiostoma belcheri]|nr:hypothetical protein Bbelb_276370 [Branchiostoma belcheri]